MKCPQRTQFTLNNLQERNEEDKRKITIQLIVCLDNYHCRRSAAVAAYRNLEQW